MTLKRCFLCASVGRLRCRLLLQVAIIWKRCRRCPVVPAGAGGASLCRLKLFFFRQLLLTITFLAEMMQTDIDDCVVLNDAFAFFDSPWF
ncbi:hypothetical protein Hdeb2414_s0008g00286371 [Helianthus debilis subsp. tardiflorus]